MFFMSCTSAVQRPAEKMNSLALVDISEGLPRDGQWRHNLVLYDMEGDGFLDIVTPPARMSKEATVPHIFVRDRKEMKWKEGAFTLPLVKGYGYGGIAVGDLNGDGYPDIVLAVHSGRIILLENDKNHGFVERPFAPKAAFHSRAVEIADVNGDGRPDIIALSEAAFSSGSYKPAGVLVAGNKGGSGDWDIKVIDGSDGEFGDAMSVGDLKGDGSKDIVIAPLIGDKDMIKPIWFGDGKGSFSGYSGSVIPDNAMTFLVRAGDVDGDGKDEVVFKLSGFGQDAKIFLSAHKWNGAGFADISKGLETIENPIVFDLADVDGDGKKELVVLSIKGISVYKLTDKGWVESGFYGLPSAETSGAYDLKAGRNRDGSLLIAYILGRPDPAFNRGIRAYLLK